MAYRCGWKRDSRATLYVHAAVAQRCGEREKRWSGGLGLVASDLLANKAADAEHSAATFSAFLVQFASDMLYAMPDANSAPEPWRRAGQSS